MAQLGSHQPGAGPPAARDVIDDVLGMLRQSFVRVAGAAVVFFALPAVLAGTTEAVIESVGPTESLVVFSVALAAVIVAATLRILGPIAFAGFLDQAVAKEYLHGRHQSLGEVMSALPWRSLIAGDVIVTVVVGVGLTFLVIPGLVLYGLLGLIGPVIVQEGAPLGASFRRTVRLARFAPALVAILVVAPFALEQVLHALMYEALHSSGLGTQVVVEWIVAIVVGGTLGLLEVALAAELMARNPKTSSAGGQAGPLLDDRQAASV